MHLNSKSRALLMQILETRSRARPELQGLVDRTRLSDDEVGALCEVLTEEFLETGLGPNDEPNDRGLQIEQLLDDVNRQRIRGRHP